MNKCRTVKLGTVKTLTAMIVGILSLCACQKANNTYSPDMLTNLAFPEECHYSTLSPDNKWVICERYGAGGEKHEPGLWIAQSDVGTWQQLTACEDAGRPLPYWSPDSQKLALWRDDPSVWLYEAGNWDECALFYKYTGDGVTAGIRWSPDGKYLAVANNIGGLTLVHSDEAVSEVLLEDGTVGMAHVSISDTVWSPDSKQIAYWTVPDTDWKLRHFKDFQLWSIDLETRERRFLVSPEPALRIRFSMPTWSPDGKWIAFKIFQGIALLEMGSLEWTSDVSQGWDQIYNLTWSPDNSHLAILSRPSKEDPSTDIWVLSIASGAIDRLTQTGRYREIIKWTEEGIVALGENNTIEIIPVE